MNVDRGDIVSPGQLLARLNSAVESASVDTQAAKAGFGARKRQRNEELQRKQLISAQELDELTTEQQMAELELRERRAVEAAKGRDKLLGARQQAVEAIEKCLHGRDLPPLLKNFLELTWTDVLVFILLRGGERSGEWQKACDTAEQLAWSGTPLDENGRVQLGQLRIGLLEELRKGLELLGGYHEDEIGRAHV